MITGNACISENSKVYDHAQISEDVKVYGDAEICGNANIVGESNIYNNRGYITFRNMWCEDEYFTWTKDDDMWHYQDLYLTSEKLKAKVYEFGERYGKFFDAAIEYTCKIKELDE